MLRRRIDPTLAARLDADDLLSETFLRASRKWAWFQGQSSVSDYVWLYGLARDVLFETWRSNAGPQRNLHRDQPLPDQSSVQLGLRLIDSGTHPSTAAVRAEQRDRMRQAMAVLKTADLEILWMRQADGLSFRDAAAVLGVTENAATVRYVRALQRLKEIWIRLYGSGGSHT